MADTEDTWLAIGAAASVAAFGLCVLGVVIRRCYASKPQILLKPSRSDNDLESMMPQEDPRT